MKPALVIFGNCQAGGLFGAVATLPSCSERYDIVYVPSHASLGNTAVAPGLLDRCEILWEQVGLHQRIPGWQSVRPDQKHIRFAELSFPILWPFNCVDPRNRHDPPDFPWGPWPYGDRLALQIAKEGLRGSEAVAAYLDRGARLMPDPARMLTMEMVRSTKRDANVDLSMSSYVRDTFRTRRLFSTYNHASNALVWELFTRLLARTVQTDMTVPGSELDVCMQNFFDPDLVWPNFDTIQMPIHPKLAEAYQLAWVDNSTRYRHYDAGRFTWDEFITRYVAYPFDIPQPARVATSAAIDSDAVPSDAFNPAAPTVPPVDAAGSAV